MEIDVEINKFHFSCGVSGSSDTTHLSISRVFPGSQYWQRIHFIIIVID